MAAALAACLLGGCASEISLRAPDVNLRDARLVFMPSMVALYRIDGCDLPFDDGRSKGGRARVDGWLRYYAAVANGRLAALGEVAGTDVTTNEFYEVMNTLTRAMFADWGKSPLSAWRLSRPLSSWATALHTDYLVVVIVRGSVLVQGSQAFCRNAIISPLQRAGLVVVELQTGRIVRFQAAKLDDTETITEGVRKLMGALDLPTATAK